MPRRRLEIDRPRRWLRLIAAVAILAVLWVGVLPMVGRQPAIREYIERNERLGIDPGAKFYTELPGMPAFFDQVETARRRNEAAFWPE